MKPVKYLADTYPRGLFVPGAAAVFGSLKTLSFGRWLVRRVSRGFSQDQGKLPAALGDLYQALCLICIAVMVLVWPLAAPAGALVGWLAASVLLYRGFEIAAILAAWIFVDTAPLHSYRRSVIGFTLNAVEISLIAAGLAAWFQCGDAARRAWLQFVAVVSVNAETSAVTRACEAISVTRFIVSAALVLLVFATLAGGLIRKEVRMRRPDKRLQPAAADVIASRRG